MPVCPARRGARCADQEADNDFIRIGGSKRRKTIAKIKNDGESYGNHRNRTVLPAHKGFRALADSIGDALHVGGSGVGAEDGACKDQRRNQAENANGERDPEIKAVRTCI